MNGRASISRILDRPARAALRSVRAVRTRAGSSNDKHLLLACMPKSGSSFLVESLLDLTGFERRNPLAAGYRHENDLYEPALIDAIGHNSVAQIHVRATEHNLELMSSYRWQPIVLVRDLADVMVSLRDHICNEGPLWSMAWIDERFSDLSDNEQLAMLVDLAAPWFINFYVSWTQATRSQLCEPLWVNFADWTGSPAATLERIATWAALDVDSHTITTALDNARTGETRLNVGRSGRGAELLTASQHDRLRSFTRYYPDIDFGPIGLG